MDEQLTLLNSLKEGFHISHEQYCNLIEKIPFPIMLSSVSDNRCLYMNQRAADLFEIPDKQSLKDYIHNYYVNPQKRQQLLDNLLTTGQVRNFEVLMKTKSGLLFHALISSTLTVFKDELAVCSVFNDITNLKRVEEELSGAYQRLDQIIDFLPDATFVIDKEGKVIAWNRAIEEMTGVAKSDIIGKGDYEYALPFYGERRMLLSDLILLPDKDSELKKYDVVENRGNVLYGETYAPGAYKNRGAYLWVTASLLRNAEGNITGAIESLRDVTERKQTAELLKNSENKYRNIFENATEGIFQSTPDGQYISLNPAFAKIRGFNSPQELLNTTAKIQEQTYVHIEDRIKMIELLNKQDFVNNYEVEAKRKDGTIIWISMNVKPVRDENGNIALLEGTISDITERKRAEKELQDSEEMFRKLFENHAAVKLLIDSGTGNIIDANEAAVDFYGWSREQLRQMKIQDINTLSPEQVKQAMEKARAGKRIRFEFQHRRADGSVRDVEVLSSKLDIKGKKCLHSIVNDITERKRAEKALRESEEQYRTLADSGLALIWTSGIDKKRDYFNQPWLNFTGRTLEQEIGDGWTASVHPDDLAHCIEVYTGAFDHRERFSMNYRLRYCSGEYRWIQDDGTPRYDSTGNFIGYIGYCLDITERKRIEEELLRAHKLESLGVLAGGIAHDFNNLMAMVQGYIELTLLDLPSDHISRQRLLIAMQSVEHTKDLTSRLITFSQGGDPHKEFFDITEIIRDAVSKTAEETKVRVVFDFIEKLCPVKVDEFQMKQVFYNLTTNAVEAMPEGGLLTVQAENTVIHGEEVLDLKEGYYLKITFTDEGTGISDEQLPKIFDPYFTTKKMAAQKGLGLGLAVCYSVVKKHGGNITVKSQPGKGSSFVLYLPVRTDPATGKN